MEGNLKRIKYKPLTTKVDIIDGSAAISHSAYILDIAAKIATAESDTDTLIRISEMLLTMAQLLEPNSSEEEEEENISAPYGFIGNKQHLEKQEREIDGESTDQNPDTDRLYLKHRKL